MPPESCCQNSPLSSSLSLSSKEDKQNEEELKKKNKEEEEEWEEHRGGRGKGEEEENKDKKGEEAQEENYFKKKNSLPVEACSLHVPQERQRWLGVLRPCHCCPWTFCLVVPLVLMMLPFLALLKLALTAVKSHSNGVGPLVLRTQERKVAFEHYGRK